jgi:hypothetical protein
MLPQDAIIFFMQANTIFNRLNTTSIVREMGIKVPYVTQAVTALKRKFCTDRVMLINSMLLFK